MSDDPANDLATRYVNLADPRLGAAAIHATDEFFAPKERMLDPAPAQFIPGKYDDHGKWMDGWESRRKRIEGHDYCVVRLALPGIVKGVDIDTGHFTGNYPPAASIDASLTQGEPTDKTAWTEILPSTGLRGNAHHLLAVASDRVWSHVRLNIYPDGGVARLRVYGQVHRDWSKVDKSKPIDLAAALNGGRAVACSDRHYGTPFAMLMPGRGETMGDGWETARRRQPGNEWAVLQLGHPGRITRVEVDTHLYKGNYPDRCSIQAGYLTGGTDQSAVTQSMFWRSLLPEQKLQPDHIHVFEREVADLGPVTHVRFNSIPDGGVMRLHLIGLPE
ncbi:MAG: allantoicase [Dongiaceae bacterium]